MEELSDWISRFDDKIDAKTQTLIFEKLKTNQFTSRLQLKLLSAEQVDLMFGKELSLGAKTLLLCHLDTLKDESPLPVSIKPQCNNNVTSEGTEPRSRRSVLPALQQQANKIKAQLEKEKEELKEIEINIESMSITVQELPVIGTSRVVCSFCHHRGHRNQNSKPCKMNKCVDYTFCGIREKHPEYFSKLHLLKQDLKKKKKDIRELEEQVRTMENFSSNNEYHFVKNQTPRLFAVDPSYKTNRPKLMLDVRLLRICLDGKIPPVTTNDSEQLKILLTRCKKNIQQTSDAPDLFEFVDSPTSSNIEKAAHISSPPLSGDFLGQVPNENGPVSDKRKSSSTDFSDGEYVYYRSKMQANSSGEAKSATTSNTDQQTATCKSPSSSDTDDERRWRKRRHKRKRRKSKHHSCRCNSNDQEWFSKMRYFPHTLSSHPYYSYPVTNFADRSSIPEVNQRNAMAPFPPHYPPVYTVLPESMPISTFQREPQLHETVTTTVSNGSLENKQNTQQ